MTYREPTAQRRTRSTSLAAPVVASAMLIAVAALLLNIGDTAGGSTPGSGPPTIGPEAGQPTSKVPGSLVEGDRRHRRAPAGSLGQPGHVRGRGKVFDDEDPAVANLDPALLAALRQAATGAADDGIQLHVNSGWRSAEHQEQLLRDAITQYGSEAEASRWVADPQTSAHVSGDAVDVGPAAATAWLSEHGRAYGLCQIYRNEPWHYELRPEAIERGCPPMYPNPTHDPRLQR